VSLIFTIFICVDIDFDIVLSIRY